MPRRPPPKLVQLDPSGRHVTPTVASFWPALDYPPEGGLPMRLCFVLSDGAELHLPVTPEIACEIRDNLTKLFPPDEADDNDAEKQGDEGAEGSSA